MSMTIPDVVSGATRLHAAAGANEPPQIQRTEAEVPVFSRAPVVDKYIPEEKQEPSGRYWLGRDEDGRPKVCFDDPERADGKSSGTPAPEKKAGGDKAEQCTGSTDQVDREIRRLRKQKETLERQLSAQTDEIRRRELERKLAQVERELAQKDNDTYRRQHTVFS